MRVPGLDEPVLDRVERAGDPDLSPVSSATSRSAVCSVRLAALRRALGEGPGPAVALATAAADDEPRLPGFVADDDAAGGGGGRGPQARHGAEAALGPTDRRAGRRSGPSASRHAGAGGRRADRAPTAGWIERQRPRQADQRRDIRAAQDGRPLRRSRGTGRRHVQAEPALPRPDRGAHEMGRRPGRVLRGDAVIHGPQWYRFSLPLQERGRISCGALRCQRATGDRRGRSPGPRPPR